MIKNIYRKPIADIILNSEKLEAFPIRSGTRQECSFSPPLPNIILEAQTNAIEKEIRGTQTRKAEIKVLLSTNDMVVYVENKKESKVIYKSQLFPYQQWANGILN